MSSLTASQSVALLSSIRRSVRGVGDGEGGVAVHGVGRGEAETDNAAVRRLDGDARERGGDGQGCPASWSDRNPTALFLGDDERASDRSLGSSRATVRLVVWLIRAQVPSRRSWACPRVLVALVNVVGVKRRGWWRRRGAASLARWCSMRAGRASPGGRRAAGRLIDVGNRFFEAREVACRGVRQVPALEPYAVKSLEKDMILDSLSVRRRQGARCTGRMSLPFGRRRSELFAVPPCDVSGEPCVSGAAGRVPAGRGSPTTTAPATAAAGRRRPRSGPPPTASGPSGRVVGNDARRGGAGLSAPWGPGVSPSASRRPAGRGRGPPFRSSGRAAVRADPREGARPGRRCRGR